jgi:hypothetical protein
MMAPNAQLKRITMGRGNSGANTEPDESRLQRWYWQATSSNRDATHFTESGRCKGQTNRVATSSQGRPNMRWKI